jgi:hypothetical protein
MRTQPSLEYMLVRRQPTLHLIQVPVIHGLAAIMIAATGFRAAGLTPATTIATTTIAGVTGTGTMTGIVIGTTAATGIMTATIATMIGIVTAIAITTVSADKELCTLLTYDEFAKQRPLLIWRGRLFLMNTRREFERVRFRLDSAFRVYKFF